RIPIVMRPCVTRARDSQVTELFRYHYIPVIHAGVSMSIPLVPVPNRLENRGGGAFVINERTRIFADPVSRAAVELFTTQLRRAAGFDLKVQPQIGRAHV